MLIKTLSAAVSGAKVTSRKPPQAEVCFVVKTTYALRGGALEPLEDQPALSADLYADDDDERAGECLYPGDFADWKPRGEVMLRGACHAPGGRPAEEVVARLTVGSWSKALRVVGRRGPFTKVELSYANAAGGPGNAANPVGRPSAGDGPTIEIAEGGARDVPASFGPVNPAWAPRLAKRGTMYGAAWRKERAPYFAEDFDWKHFQSAPADQQLDGFLRGDEEIVLSGFAADGGTRCRLPGKRVRVFIKDVAAKHQELPMALDTLYIDTALCTVTVVWRGLGPAARQDLADLAFALVVDEPLGEEGDVAAYRAQLDAFADDPIGIKGKMPPELLELQERDRRIKAGEPLPDEAEIAKLDPISATMRRSMGTFAEKEQALVVAQIAAAGPLPPQLSDALAKSRVEHGETPPLAFIKKPGRMPTLGLVHTVRRVMGEVAKIKESLRGKEALPEVAAKLAELDAIPHQPRLLELDPSYHPPEPLSTDAPAPYADLRERDLSGMDLRGLDLRGANLEDAILIKTNLRGANLAGANLRRAVLFKADAGLASFDGADFEGANLASLHAEAASLREAKLDFTFLEAANLEGADLSGAKGEYTLSLIHI